MSTDENGTDPARVTRLIGELAACPPQALASASVSSIQTLTAIAARAYGAARERGFDGDPVAPERISATDAVVLCRGLLHAADIELFELSMWGAIQTDPLQPGKEAR